MRLFAESSWEVGRSPPAVGGALPCQAFIRPFYTTMRVFWGHDRSCQNRSAELSTYENARQIKSEQMRIPIKAAWQGGALPRYTRTLPVKGGLGFRKVEGGSSSCVRRGWLWWICDEILCPASFILAARTGVESIPLPKCKLSKIWLPFCRRAP